MSELVVVVIISSVVSGLIGMAGGGIVLQCLVAFPLGIAIGIVQRRMRRSASR